MSTAIDMGRVVVTLKLRNYGDELLAESATPARPPREIEVEALVGTGATLLSLKPSVIKALGLKQVDTLRSRTANGICQRACYAVVRLDLMGRHGFFDVVEVPEDVPNLLGQIPLERLDLVVDPGRRRLIGNPEHGGEQMIEEYFTP